MLKCGRRHLFRATSVSNVSRTQIVTRWYEADREMTEREEADPNPALSRHTTVMSRKNV